MVPAQDVDKRRATTADKLEPTGTRPAKRQRKSMSTTSPLQDSIFSPPVIAVWESEDVPSNEPGRLQNRGGPSDIMAAGTGPPRGSNLQVFLDAGQPPLPNAAINFIEDIDVDPLLNDRLGPASGFGPFHHAHDFVINNPIFIHQIRQFIHTGDVVLYTLAEKQMRGVDMDSSIRSPPPRCHPDTRTSIRCRIFQWLELAVNHQRRMLWVLGPVGTGKSALAQTIADEMKAIGRLGAALFFSRSNHQNDPDRVIPTLAYQLSRKHPQYKRLISQRLADDLTILEKSRRAQFKELIIEPFHNLMTQGADCVREPLLIILDGLDECNGTAAQCDFVEMISDHIRMVPRFPLLWMICSRPEWHFTYLLTEPDFYVICKRENLRVDDAEAQRDVVRVLRDKFEQIRRRYQHQLQSDWPPERALREIVVVAKGIFAISDTITRFVEDEAASDPFGRLEACVQFLNGSGISEMQPLHALDLLYQNIMSKIPSAILPTTRRILGLDLFFGGGSFGAIAQANLLRLTQPTFYHALRQLASVLHIPPAAEISYLFRIRYYHASFEDFLRNPQRSGKYCIDEAAVNYEVVAKSIQCNAIPQNSLISQFSWQSQYSKFVYFDLKSFIEGRGTSRCTRLLDTDLPAFEALLQDIDFRLIPLGRTFVSVFVPWLISTVPSVAHLKRAGCCLHPIAERRSTGYWADNLARYARSLGHKPIWHKVVVHLGPRQSVCEIVINVLDADFLDIGEA